MKILTTFVCYTILFTFVLLNTHSSYGQKATKKRTAPHLWSASVQHTSDKGYIVVGGTHSYAAGQADCWVLKLDPDGNDLWHKTYGGDDSEAADTIIQTSDNGYVVVGYKYISATGRMDGWIMKLDSKGNEEWQKTYGGDKDDVAISIQQTHDGGYIVAGRTWSLGAVGSDAWILKLNPNGDMKWQKTYGGKGHDVANCIVQTSDGGYIVTGDTTSFNVKQTDAWILKLNSDGEKQWQETYGGDSYDVAHSILPISAGGYIVAGNTNSFGAGGSDIWLLKLNAKGKLLWQKTYGGSDEDLANSVWLTDEGGYIVAGKTSSFGSKQADGWILKLDSEGKVQWEKIYGTDAFDLANFAQQTSDGGYIISGTTYNYGRKREDLGENFWVLKLNSKGKILWQKTHWEE